MMYAEPWKKTFIICDDEEFAVNVSSVLLQILGIYVSR